MAFTALSKSAATWVIERVALNRRLSLTPLYATGYRLICLRIDVVPFIILRVVLARHMSEAGAPQPGP